MRGGFCCFGGTSTSEDTGERIAKSSGTVDSERVSARKPEVASRIIQEPGHSTEQVPYSSFSEVCQAYSRGAFEPAKPSGRISQDPTPPRTPSGSHPSPADGTHSNSYEFHGNSNSTNSHGSHQTGSSGHRSMDSNYMSRPQPVEDLQQRIRDKLDPHSVDTAFKSKPSRNSSSSKPYHHGHASDKASALESGGHSWLSVGASEAERGAPVKELAQDPVELKMNFEVMGIDDPLEGNPHFELLNPLIPGASSSVYLCRDVRDDEKVAIKLVSRGVTNAKAAEREIANLRLCALHPYIVHLREVFLTSAHLAIVFDYAPGGNLAHYIETFQSSKPGRGISEERTRWIFQQIVVAVDFCHRLGIANRDIKLENVLLVPSSQDPTEPPIVKLSDFGFSKDENADSLCKTACGTPECVAPEILSGELYNGKSSDIWSLGVLFFAMLTGTFPFSRPSDDDLDNTVALRKLFARISRAQYPIPQHVSRNGRDLLHRMLQVDPEERIDIAGILDHPWFESLQSVALNVNKGLLEMPDSMLTGFAKQSEEEIAEIMRATSQRIHLQSD